MTTNESLNKTLSGKGKAESVSGGSMMLKMVSEQNSMDLAENFVGEVKGNSRYE